MALTLKLVRGQAAVRFEYSDGTAETVVTVDATDDEETIVRKLARVIALAGGATPAPAPEPVLMPTERPAGMRRPELTAEQIGNGWERYDADDLAEAP